MEGDGMVAIVQGLKDAGLAVTLMRRTHLQNSLRPELVPVSKSSVETSTDHVFGRSTAAQIRDGHYTSSYQLAHCNVRPTSPPQRLSEFPPQRPEPSRNQGNFQVGGYGRGENNLSPIPSHYGQAFRGGMVWPDRGSVSGRISPPAIPSQTDPFIHSLRRYPRSISPERSISAELVQRLINYTQNKHLAKKHNSHSPRSLREEIPTKDKKTDTKASKNIQTYTRTKNEPTRDSGANTNNEIRFSLGKKGRSFSSTSPYNVRSKSYHQDTYDYLKGSPRCCGRHPEVRYLNDVKKCIRDTIKQIYDDKPLVCPQIKSRYSQHKKEHHRDSELCPDVCDADEAQASATTSHGVPVLGSCLPPVANPTSKDRICSFCKKPVPCECAPSSNKQGSTRKTKRANFVECACGNDDLLTNPASLIERICSFCKKPVPCECEPSSSIQESTTKTKRANSVECTCGKNDLLTNQASLIERICSFCKKPIPCECEPSSYKQETTTKTKRDNSVECTCRKNDLLTNQASLIERICRFCKKPVPCECEPSSNKQESTANTKRTNSVECACGKDDLLTNPTSLKDRICRFCKKPVPCECDHTSSIQRSSLEASLEPKEGSAKAKQAKSVTKYDDKFADAIFNWLKDLPVYADESAENKVKREEMIEGLADKLKRLKGVQNYEEKAKEEIKKCIEKLPIWYPGAKRDQEMFKNQIADDLLSRLTSTGTDGLKEVIEKWLDDVQFEDEVDRDQIVDDFVQRLKPIVDQQDEMKPKIENMLQELPILNKNKVITKLANKLISDLTDMAKKDTKDKRISTDSTDEELEKKIMDWLEDTPELYQYGDVKENEMMVKSLVKKLKKAEVNGLDTEEHQQLLKEELVDWIDSVLHSKGEKLDTKTKNKISNKLLDKLASAAKFTSNSIDRMSSIQDDYQNQIWDWLEDVVDIPEEAKNSHKKLVKNLAQKLQEFKLENADDEVVEDKIVEFLESLSNKGVSVRSTNKSKLAKKLMAKLTTEPNPSKGFVQDEDLQKLILNEISDLVDDIPSNINKIQRTEIKDKISNILTRNIDHLSDKNDNIQREIANILKKEAKMSDNESSELAMAFINRTKGMPFSGQSSVTSRSSKTDDEMKKLVSEEVSDVLNDYNINAKKRKEIEKSITEVLADQVVRGTDDRRTKDKIFSILQDTNLSEGDANDISNRLLERSKELSLSYKTQDSKLGIGKSRLSRGQSRFMSPMEREHFEEKAKSEILDFIEGITGDDSPRTRKKRSEMAAEVVHKLGDIMSDPDEIDKEKSMIEELSQYFQKLSIDLDTSSGEEFARTLASRLQGIGFQASTPKKDGYSFLPKRNTIDISSIRIDDDDSAQRFEKPSQEQDNEEKQYLNELTKLIQSWMDELSVDLSATEDKGFKETMIQDLAGDILDRQKYLQLNPDAKSSDQEELEHLKYQMFRWLNKLLDIDDLSSIMQKTDILMTKIKDVNVPELVKPAGKRTASQGIIPDSMDSIIDEISMWMEEIPENLYASTDKHFQKQMINELAEKIQQLKAYNQTGNIDNEISNWLSKLIKDADKPKLTRMTEALKERLKHRRFTEASFMLNQDSSQFIEENLIGGIQDWFKSLPLYQKRNSNEKRKIESLIPELVKGLQSVFEFGKSSTGDTDRLFMDEIVKHLKKFPMDLDQKSDEDFLHRTAAQLLHYLKGLQLFQNISERRDRSSDEYLLANVEDWINSLPITQMNSTDTMHFENLKTEFESRVKQIREEDPTNEQKLKDEIKNYLLKFPIDEVMKQNQEFINDKVEQLFKNLLAVPIVPAIRYGSDKFVKNAVANWITSLPLEKGKTVKDINSSAIDDLTSAVAELLVKTDSIQIGDIKNILEEETEKFLKSVPLDPNVNYDVKSLAEALFKDVKEMSRKISTGSDVRPPVIKKAADILFDNIQSWCDNLPLKGDTPDEKEKAKKVKNEITSKLIHKIGELNMNPEVFTDDFLYDEMLEDEIDNLLTDLSSQDIRDNIPTIKKDLMEKIKEGRQKTQEEVAGKAYKQQLREAISKTLPSQSLTPEEQATFEVLKDNLADAFINLHYVGGDEELKTKYKTKINDEVDKFCNDYLKKHPASPIDSKKLNQDLYNALKGIPIPKEETVRNEVELVKIKDELNEWVKELPSNNQTAAEKLQTNKMTTVLAKKLHDIEKQKELAPDVNYDDVMRKEITKFIKKLPMNINDTDVTELTDKLINNLKSTEKSRRISASTRHSIEPDLFDSKRSSTEHAKTCKPTSAGVYKPQYAIPPSTLSLEDTEHLKRIRERCPVPRVRYPPSKDASVSPLPVDEGSQTEIRPWQSRQPTCEKRLAQQSSAVQTQRPPEQKRMQAVGSQAEVSPQVIVKEYYWDTMDASKMQGPCAPCPSQFPPGMFTPGAPQSQFAPGSYSQFTPGPNPAQFTQGPTPQPQFTPTPGPCSPEPQRPMPQQPSRLSQESQGPCTYCPRMSPRASIPGLDPEPPTPQPRRARKESEQPCCRPGVSSENLPEPGTSRSFRTPKARITRLGSFDEMKPKCSRSRNDWAKFPEDDEFWKDRRFASDDDETILKERKQEEVSCRCRERILTKCAGRKRGRGCQVNDDVKRCSKCCGVHCPYPSYLYFRQ